MEGREKAGRSGGWRGEKGYEAARPALSSRGPVQARAVDWQRVWWATRCRSLDGSAERDSANLSQSRRLDGRSRKTVGTPCLARLARGGKACRCRGGVARGQDRVVRGPCHGCR